MNDAKDSDRKLLAACAAGDRLTADRFVRRFSDPVYRTIQFVLSRKDVGFNDHDLEDLHNLVFLGLFEKDRWKLRQYRGENDCSVLTWLQTVTTRMVIDQLRSKGVGSLARQKRLIPIEEIYDLQDDSTPAWAALERAEQLDRLRRAIAALPARDNLFTRLHFEQELSLRELAETMQISMQNAYTMKHRVIKKLRQAMAVEQPDDRRQMMEVG